MTPIAFAPVPPLDLICKVAHEQGRAVLLTGARTFEIVPAPPPGEPLSTWPLVTN